MAHRLRALGIGPEDRVALCAGRSPELVIGLLGILKAGAACVPLDPSHLSERLAFVLEDSGAVALATTSDLAPRLPASIPRVFLDQLGTEMSPVLAGVPPVHPEQLAYVIYTSGSTGRPKGVAVAHRAAAEHFAQVIRLYGLGPADRVLQFASPAFDVAMEEILPTLAAGAAVVLREELWDTETLAGRLEDLGITVLNLPSAVWHAWAHDAVALPASPAGVPAGLRLIIVGGEEVLTEPARQWLRTPLAAIPVLNGYGPTEAVITATLHPIAPDTLGDGAMVPIGRPLPGRIGVVLDRRGNPVPPGAAGELHLGGCLARGYLNRPGLTAERFVPDPLGEPGSRLYRSGDLVRVRHGALEFLGRIDQQVKIRGFRIEPAEIEAALTAHPGVATAIVVVRGVGNEKQLAALIVPTVPDAEPPTAAGLRSFLEPRLPAWMVPTGFAFCDRRERLPLTSSGKVDRAAIARLSFDQRDPDEAPRTAVEQALAEIWQEVLNVERIGRGEDFFRLGGHSLLAMRLLSRIRASFGVDLRLRDVFTAPTLAAQALHIEQTLARPTPPNTEALQPTSSSQAAPLSFAQQRLWFLDRLMGGSAAYNVPMAFTLRGPGLRVAALAAALGEIVRRHEPLRTVFEPVGGEPVQIVTTPEPRLPVADLAALPEPARQSETARLVREEGRRPFDLRRGPILRAALLRLSAAEHVLLLGVHHIAFDAWSLGVLRRELAELYPAFAAGRPSPLPPLPLRYSDFAAWQRRWLSGEVLESQLGYWREKLANRPAGLDLPLDRPRPAVQSWRGGHVRLGLPRELFDQLQRLGQGSHATPFMTLFAGYQTLLHRITGQDDFLVGTPVANRDRADVHDLIGFFVNTLVLRSDLSGSPGFGELLARVRETCVQAYAHQDLPFERLVTELDPARDLSRTPLFQTLFTWVPAQGGTTELAPGLTLEIADLEAATSKFDLSLLVGESQEGPYVLAEYAADLFDAASVRRLLGHLRQLLEGAAREPETPVSALPLLTAEERAQLAAWDNVSCRARRDRPCQDLLHGLFEAQARRTPDAPALVVPGAGGGTSRTYAELEERSARLAQRLRARGAGPEVGVAVCLRRSAKLVEALLAVLRSGAFYVPIDPSYPAERIAFLLEDSRCGVLLTESGIFRELGKLPSSDAPMILLDTDEPWEMPELEGGGEASPSNLAYLIYTSGSTGRPKAVAIEHRSAVTFALWARDAFAPEELRGVIAATAVTFDLSVFEIFVPLAWGGTVILVENALAVPELTARGMLPLGIEATLINTVPSAISVLLREGGLPRSVRTINLAGEALSRSLADRVHARPETERLNNLYGPSEDTTYSTWARLERAERTESTPRIGRPIDDTRAYVLDRRLERVPAGVPGELFLAGAGLARGYRGRPELTAERFLPDPFADSDRAGERMYRTGDRVRLRADYGLDNQLDNRLDHVLDYLGRLDRQVKIRGFRIELGEIEEALAGQPGVEAAVVVARQDRPGDMRLIAYVVARSGATEATGATTPAELRRALQRSLPEPMVPSLFVLLDALPLTPHGKVDRKALPAPEASLGGPQYVPPRTALEKELETAWKEVLGVERVGLEDSFWELGGHSLLATKALSRIYDTLGLDLPLQALFEAPTLGAFAERVGAHALAEDTEDDWSSLLSEMDHLSEEEVRVLLADEIQNG
ncbi:MAG TPA: amino acid adenylation domain-containing protein [Thermoanaerobaculia bacterium]|nr:amino acid adenylation domain-containing protein [Thermoanaerobaculia bacterium]